MRKLLILVTAFTVLGCGGSGGANTFGLPPLGTYAGQYNDQTGTKLGSANVTISAGDNLSGTLVNSTNNNTLTFTGTYDASGNVTGNYSNSGQPGTYTASLTCENNSILTISSFVSSANNTLVVVATKQ